MANFVRDDNSEIALEAGLEPAMTVFDIARIMIEQGHELFGKPFDGELDHDPDFEFLTPNGLRLVYSPPEKKSNGIGSPSHEEFIELPADLYTPGKRPINPKFYPQHLLRVERSSSPDLKGGDSRWLTAVSGMGVVDSHPRMARTETIGVATLRVLQYPDGTARNVSGGAVFEGKIVVPGVSGGLSTNVDTLPPDYTLEQIMVNRRDSAGQNRYVGWSFMYSVAMLRHNFQLL